MVALRLGAAAKPNQAQHNVPPASKYVEGKQMLFRIGITLSVVAFAAAAWASNYYKVEVTRKAEDFYEVQGQSIYVKTRYCHEYVHSSDAILKIDSTVGNTIGQIIFVGNGGTQCDIEKLLK